MKQLMLALAVAASFPAMALDRGTNGQGRSYVSGGVTPDEVAMINSEKGRYPLSILTAARTGAYLSDVRIQIIDDRSNVVLDTVMDGPWLLADLPPGRYQVQATDNATVKRMPVSLRAGEHRQTAFYFDTNDDVEKPTAASAQATEDADLATRVTQSGPIESGADTAASQQPNQ